VFQHPGFTAFALSRLGSAAAIQIQSVAVGWQVYVLTGDPLDLGLVGLAQFLPAFLLLPLTGLASDRWSRRAVMSVSLVGQAACALVLALFAYRGTDIIWPILLVATGFGAARAFLHPAQQAIVANLVPAEQLGSAVAVTSALLRVGSIIAPLLAGVLMAASIAAAYAAAVVTLIGCLVCTLLLPATGQKRAAVASAWQALADGVKYVWREKIVLGAISLDMFAVLLGGAVALLPVYASDVLNVGPAGLGLLRAAPAVGGIAVGLYLSVLPIRDRAGDAMFATVAMFGFSIFVFGVSEVLWLSVIALAVMGGSDLVSVYIRATLVQLWTPDEMRGRVSAVNTVFMNASNEIGAFRAGVTAALIGAVPAVALGGLATVAVTALWLKWFPELRAVRRLDAPKA
jgi:MFS family permease